jgi:hypothetical protein
MKLKNYLLDLVALLFSFFLAVFIKFEVEALLLRIEQYSALLESANLSVDSYVGLVQMEQYIEGFSSLVTVAYILILVVLPLGLYFAFCFSQGYNFRNYFGKKFSLKYLLKFFVLGVPFFLFILFVLGKLFDVFFINFNSFFDFVWIGFYLLLMLFFGFVWLSFSVLLSKGRLKWSRKLKKVFRIDRFFWFVLMFVVVGLILFLSFVMFVNVITWSFFDWFGWFVFVVLGLVWLFGFFRSKFLGRFK